MAFESLMNETTGSVAGAILAVMSALSSLENLLITSTDIINTSIAYIILISVNLTDFCCIIDFQFE